MAQYIVVKKKNKVLSLEAVKCNLKRARLITSHPFDKYAKYLICEVIEEVNSLTYEDRESV